jgi:hypothetical protein
MECANNEVIFITEERNKGTEIILNYLNVIFKFLDEY